MISDGERDDGGDVQRAQLRNAGVLIASDATLRPTTTLICEDISGNQITVASVLIDVTQGEYAQRVITMLREVAEFLETAGAEN